MNSKSLSVWVLATGLLTTPAFAGHGPYGHDAAYGDYAKVLDVDPIVRQVRVSTPRRECWDRQVQVPVDRDGYRSATPMILGGIIGGVVGSNIGNGRGRDAATIAGAVLGGSIARDVSRRGEGGPDYTTATETHCRTVNDYHQEQRVEGYRVTYRYHGRRFVTRMNHDPGRRLRVRVTVVPSP
ncbi:MAG TPA: glycine zipper 2TM domain-containing protein [Gammaproteobacteria bacterium]|nr:glycine zipper 2TM domain-containing protein [Gammaproteobacteria bacterium]